MAGELRQAFLDAIPQRKAVNVNVNGKLFEVRQATMADRAKILAAGGIDTKDDGDSSAMLVEAAMLCTYEPGSNKRVFEQSDKAALLQAPAGSAVQSIGMIAIELMKVDVDAAKKDLPISQNE